MAAVTKADEFAVFNITGDSNDVTELFRFL